MAKFIAPAGTTSQIIHLFVQSAGVTNGVGLTGLSFSSAGLACAYIRNGQAAHSVVTLTGSGLNLGTYVSGAFLQVSSGTMPGVYEFHVPNAAVTNSGNGSRVVFIVQGNASMAPVPFEIQLSQINLDDATRGGMTSIPSTIPGATGGIIIVGVGSGNLNPIAGNVMLQATTHSGATIPIVSTVSRVLLADTVSTVARVLLVDTATTILSIASSGITAPSFALNAIDTSAFSQTAADRVFSVTAGALPELGQAQPPGTPTPAQALMGLYMPLRNGVTVDATFMNIQNSAGTVIFKKSVSDDGATFTELKAVAGP